MILHIMFDEKIVSRTIDIFEEALPKNNIYIVIYSEGKKQYVFSDLPNVHRLRYDTKNFWDAIGEISSYSYIVIHYLMGASIKFVNKINHPRIVWVAWGADMYGGLLRFKGYRLYYDERLIRSINNRGKSLFTIIYSFFARYFNYFRTRKAINKISFICGEKGDYLIFKRYFPSSSIRYKNFFYYPIDGMIPSGMQSQLGNNIIVGHSASSYDNQEEVLLTLSKIDLDGRTVIAPLGYGNRYIREHVVNIGTKLLSDSFIPLKEFIELDEYNKILFGARTFIYGNYRQEAFGNILVALYIGGAVFLHPSNVLLHSFKEKGVILYSTEELPSKIHYVLTDEEKNNNRRIIWDNFNHQKQLSLIRNNFS